MSGNLARDVGKIWRCMLTPSSLRNYRWPREHCCLWWPRSSIGRARCQIGQRALLEVLYTCSISATWYLREAILTPVDWDWYQVHRTGPLEEDYELGRQARCSGTELRSISTSLFGLSSLTPFPSLHRHHVHSLWVLVFRGADLIWSVFFYRKNWRSSLCNPVKLS